MAEGGEFFDEIRGADWWSSWTLIRLWCLSDALSSSSLVAYLFDAVNVDVPLFPRGSRYLIFLDNVWIAVVRAPRPAKWIWV